MLQVSVEIYHFSGGFEGSQEEVNHFVKLLLQSLSTFEDVRCFFFFSSLFFLFF